MLLRSWTNAQHAWREHEGRCVMTDLEDGPPLQTHSRGYYVGLVLMGIFYIGAGLNHFLSSQPYVAVVPPYIPEAALMVAISGAAEILGGIGVLVPRTRAFSAWGLTLMLITFLPVHINMCMHPDHFPTIPLWAIWIRLPLQMPLIAWAWYYTRS